VTNCNVTTNPFNNQQQQYYRDNDGQQSKQLAKKHLIKLIQQQQQQVKPRGRHQSDESATIDDSSSSSDEHDDSDETESESDATIATLVRAPTSNATGAEQQPEAIEVSTEVAPGLSRQWFGHVVKSGVGKALVVDLDKSDMHNGSKEAFIRLLECADECLHCSHVYVTARRDRTDHTMLMRTFMYLGFKPVPPQSMPQHVDHKNYICLATEL